MENSIDNKLIFQKENKFTKQIISSILIVLIPFIYKVFSKMKLANNDMELVSLFAEAFGLIFSMMACASFLISYKRKKNDRIFMIFLVYLSLSMSVAFQFLSCFNTYEDGFQYYNYDVVSSWSLKLVLIIIALSKSSKIKSIIINNKFKSIFAIFIYILMSTYICEYFNLYTNENFFKFANMCLIIIYFIGNLGFLYLGIKEKEYLYFTISSIMFILTIKTLYVFFNLNISQMYQMIITSSLGYLALLTIISGSFVELVMYISKVKNLNKNLKVFYNLSDNSKHSFLLICNKKGEVLYANDKFKNNYKEFATKCNYDKHNREILKGPFKILRPDDEINKIKIDLYSSGQWRGVLNIDNDNIYIDCCVQLLDPLDKDSLVSVSYIDISDIINKELELERLKVYNQEQTEFISNISHELRTPINIFYSTIQLLDRFYDLNIDNFQDIYEKYRKSLHTNCKRMLRLVNNIIDISKIETGILKGDFEYYNLISIIEDVTSSVKSYAKLKSIDIHFDTNCEEFISKCDSSMIERAILNLLSNAIKFTDENKNIYINIFAHDDFIDIHIRDEGMGISKKDSKNIFERFIQSDKSLNRKNEGSGIGLSIVKSIIELHNGHISVDSQMNIGTTFKIILPKIGEDTEQCSIFNINNYNTELELSDIYEVLI